MPPRVGGERQCYFVVSEGADGEPVFELVREVMPEQPEIGVPSTEEVNTSASLEKNRVVSRVSA